MLESLHVKNLALIDEAQVDFADGLNILTGETGAGKSIIIGSMGLALGAKIQREMLRENADYALVEMVFSVDGERQREQLLALGVIPEDGEVILSRKIVDGKGTLRVNSESVTASKMKEIAEVLIDIHGQHEHQSLLSKKKHLEILDDYAKAELSPYREKLAADYRAYRGASEELKTADVGEDERLREISFLEYEIREISGASLTVGEDEELEATYRKYGNGKKIMEAVGAAHALTGGQEESASELIGRALRELNAASAYDGDVAALASQLSELDGLVNDFNREAADYLDGTEFDDETFYRTERRLDEINRLKAKYGASIPDILEELDKKQERLRRLMDFDRYLTELKEKKKKAEDMLEADCEKVSEIRKKYAKTLTDAVTEALRDLNFLDVRFEMAFARTADYTANGTDDPEFLISTNPGEPLKPLGKVASGGELSRVMLAVKTVLADNDAVGTLVFDEIDSGISGRTAQMVSEKMSVLAKNHRIICITHLPQIAAMADTHFLIEKSVENQSTVSRIRKLSDDESVSELARMLGGVEITEKVRENAREMKELAEAKKGKKHS